MNRKTESYKTGRAYIRNDICFFGGKNETGMGIYIVLDGNRNADHVFVGGGLLGVLLIAGTMLVSYLLFSC